jgi:Tol biopolymer transport system component
LDRVIQRCLAKEPESRWQTANDLAVELRWVEKTPSLAAEPAVQAEKRTSASTRKVRVWMAAAGIFLAIAITLGLILMLADRVPAPETMRFAISMPEGMVFNGSISISPDGRRIAFSAIDAAGLVSLWVRPLDSLIAQPLPGTQGAGLPFWSPDSRSIGFFAQGKLKKIDVAGGPPQTLCDAPAGRGGSWNIEGLIIFAPDEAAPLSRVSLAGGTPTPLTKLTATQSGHRYPAFLPDGKHFIFSATTAAGAEILLGNLESGDTSVLLSASSPALFSPAGYVLFARQGVLVAQQFDTKKFRVVGEAIPVTERLQFSSFGNFVSASVSASGSLVYLPAAPDTGDFQLAWVDRTGKVLDTVGPAGPYRGVELSPDGKRIAVHRHEGTGGDVWLVEAQGPLSRLTFDPSQDNSNPIWSPDGKRIAFGSLRGGKWGIYEKPTDGTGKEELLLELGSIGAPMSWSTDGKFLAYITQAPHTGRDIWAVALTGGRKPFPVVEDQGPQSMPQISPDGKWIAYVSNETGTYEVYVRPFPTGEGHWQITTDGALGDSVRWRGDSKELFYLASGGNVPMMAVPINAGTTFQWGTPRKLFDSFYFGSFGSVHTFHDFSVTRDGQRFLIPQANRGAAQTRATSQITVVLNWTAALNKK